MAIEKVFASEVSKAVRANQSKDALSAMVAETVAETVQNEVDNDRVEYYIYRGLEEISNGVKDANFELGGIMTSDKPVITNIVTGENGNTKVLANKCFTVTDPRDITRARERLANVTVGGNFAKYVGVRVDEATDKICLNIVISLPSKYVDSIGGDDFRKRPAVVDKAVKKLLDDVLKG